MKATKYIFIIFCFGIIVSLYSCEDFLTTEPTTDISDNEVFKTVEGAQVALSGCYYHLRRQGGGGNTRQDDWGIPSLHLTFEACGPDIVLWGGWYMYDYAFWDHTRSDIFKSTILWNFHYRLITNVNPIINEVDNAVGSDEEKRHIKGQALALRGWAYFNLIRLYQQTYIIAKEMPGVPVYTETTTSVTEGKGRGTVEETYKRITDDLEDAVTLLAGFNRGGRKNIINRQVAQSILSEVYLTMNQWQKAADNANQARSGYNLMSREQFQAGFNDISNPEWIWGMEQTEEQNMGDYSPFAAWASWTRKCFSWENFLLCMDFMEMFEASDVRSQFRHPWPTMTAPYNEIYATEKFRDTDDCRGSIVFTRSAAMYLTEAEALARLGLDGQAQSVLWQLQDRRSATRSLSTGQQLIDDILIERRKELYGEGYVWFDLIRNQLPLDRRNLRGHINNQYYPAHSWRFIYQIPIHEMTNNDNIRLGDWPLGDQNPLDGIYIPQ